MEVLRLWSLETSPLALYLCMLKSGEMLFPTKGIFLLVQLTTDHNLLYGVRSAAQKGFYSLVTEYCTSERGN